MGTNNDIFALEAARPIIVNADKKDVSPAKLAFIRELLQQKYKRAYSPEEIPTKYLDKSVIQLIHELE